MTISRGGWLKRLVDDSMRRLLIVLSLVFVTRAYGQETPRAMSRDEIISLQIGLDDVGFSSGQIDGKWGAATEQALAAWQQAHDLKPTGKFDNDTAVNFPAGRPSYTNYVVTAEDLAKLTPVSEDWLERSQLTNMWYGTMLEMVAEKCHASEGLVQTLNPGVTDWKSIQSNQTVVLLNVVPAKHVTAAKLRVNLSAKTITAYDGSGKITALFPCSIAADKEKRPVGQLTVQTVAIDPNYTFDPVNFPELDDKQKGYGKLIVPAGPHNPVGVAWIGLSRTGYGIHGSPHPEQIGKTFSHGCFRLANWNATRLAQMVVIGTPVEIVLE
jgi:lipoprotein-anchoring transpeptidase ErfK/SrfK